MDDLHYCMGLFPKVIDEIHKGYKPGLLDEVVTSLSDNPWYRTRMIFFAADEESAAVLKSRGLTVSRVFSDAPDHVWRNTTYRMKAWMIQWGAENLGNVLWVDWDTIGKAEPAEEFD